MGHAKVDVLDSPISEDVTARIIEHIRNRTTDMAPADLRIPMANYVSEAHAEKERALMRRLPLIVARSSELPAVGRFITRDILGSSVIVVRQDDGKAASFLNICKHRGGKVEWDTEGAKRLFVCRYHGWSYDRNGGELRNVPYENFFEPIDRACSGLTPVKTEERHGFIWIDFSNSADRSISEWLGPDVEAQMARLRLDGATTFMEKIIPLEINWKLVLDGALDTLHPQFLHPGGVGKLIQGNTVVWKDYGRHGQLFSCRRKLVKLVQAGEPIKAAWKYFATNMLLYPNSFAITAPDHVEFWTIWPDPKSALRSTVHIRFLVQPDILNDEIAERINRSWAVLSQAAMEEDWPMEVAIQQNACDKPDGFCVFGRHEISCHHLHRELRKDIGDAVV